MKKKIIFRTLVNLILQKLYNSVNERQINWFSLLHYIISEDKTYKITVLIDNVRIYSTLKTGALHLVCFFVLLKLCYS